MSLPAWTDYTLVGLLGSMTKNPDKQNVMKSLMGLFVSAFAYVYFPNKLSIVPLLAWTAPGVYFITEF